MKADWSNDWQTFAALLVELLDSGVSEFDICAQFRGLDVQWQGRITSIDLDEEYVPGIAMSMGIMNMPMANGRLFEADHIMLHIEADENETWRSSVVGESVKFTASLRVFDDSRAEINISEYEGEPEVAVLLSLINCKRIG